MLSASAKPLIDASVPVLREHGLAITRHFYAQMFEAHPELRNIFNMGNQANGSQQQSLAAALFAYAANIENAAALAPVASRIAHKHAAVGIKPAHYPIVARHLLGAIRHVLGDAATPELLSAWDEAYWLLAGELIAAEARLYERSGADAGERMELEVSQVQRESENVVSIYLRSPGGGSPGSFAPGQYVSVAVELEGDRSQLRQYSLSDSPSAPHWRISVKREPGGASTPAGCVSNLLHDTAKVGQRLRVSAPFGDFTPGLEGNRPLALVSAGVGITPLVSVLKALPAGSERPVLFAHAARDAAHHPFQEELAATRAALPRARHLVWYEQLDGQAPAVREGRMALTPELLAGFEEAEVYLCGPLPFMRAQWQSLLAAGVPPEHMHREVFGPESLDHLL